MWQNVKYYALALAVILTGASTSTALQLLQAYLPIGHPLGALAANLSGVTIGTIIMVIGFLKDNRLDQERKRADDAIAEAAVATAKASGLPKPLAQFSKNGNGPTATWLSWSASGKATRRTTEALIQLLRERDGIIRPTPARRDSPFRDPRRESSRAGFKPAPRYTDSVWQSVRRGQLLGLLQFHGLAVQAQVAFARLGDQHGHAAVRGR